MIFPDFVLWSVLIKFSWNRTGYLTFKSSLYLECDQSWLTAVLVDIALSLYLEIDQSWLSVVLVDIAISLFRIFSVLAICMMFWLISLYRFCLVLAICYSDIPSPLLSVIIFIFGIEQCWLSDILISPPPSCQSLSLYYLV